MTQSEKDIQNEVLRFLSKQHTIRIWRNNSGVGIAMDAVTNALKLLRAGNIGEAIKTLSRPRLTKYGVNGQADLSGLLPSGLRLEIEIKKPGGRQSDAQENFQKMIESMNGIYILAYSVDDVAQALAEYL